MKCKSCPKSPGGRSQADLVSFIGHGREFELFVIAKLLEQESDMITIHF